MASKVDPNVYSLSVELSLETAAAFASLDKFSAKLTNLESDIAKAAEQSLKSILTLADQTQKAVVNLGKEFDKINDVSTKHQLILPKITKETDTQHDLSKDQLKAATEHLEITDDHEKTLLKIVKQEQIHLGLLEDEQKIIEQIIALDQKKRQEELNEVLSKTKRLFWDIYGAIVKGEEESEKFVASNYRMYGSIYDMLGSARELSSTYGLMYEEAVEVYKELGNLRIPIDQIDKYAESVAKASRYLQVNAGVLAKFSARLNGAGGSAQMATRQFEWMSEAMRKFGLSSEDVTKLMGGTSRNMHTMGRLFGMAGESAADTAIKMQQMDAGLMGSAKAHGLSTDAILQHRQELYKAGDALLLFGAAAKINIKTHEDLARAEVINSITVAKAMKGLKKGSSEANVQLEVLKETMGFANEEAVEAAAKNGELAMSMGLTGDKAEDLTTMLEKLNADGLDPLNPANQTFSRQLAILTSSLTNLWRYIGTTIGEFLMPMIRTINEIIQSVMEAKKSIEAWWKLNKPVRLILFFTILGDAISRFIKWVEQIPVIGKAFKVLRGVGYIVMGLVVALGALVGILLILGAKTFLFSLLSKGFLSLAGAIGGGLKIVGSSIKTVMKELLVIGATFLMIGLGAYFFAAGIALLTERWWQSIVVIPIFTAALIAMIMALSKVAQAIASPKILLGMAAIALVLIAIGFSVWLASEGIETITKSIISLAAVASPQLLGFLLGLGLMLAFLSIFSPLISMFAVSMLLLGLALMVVEKPITRFVQALTPLIKSILPALAAGVRDITNAVSSGIRELAAVAPILMVAALELGAGAIELAIAAGLLGAAGIALDLAMVAVAPGALVLSSVGVLLNAGASGIHAAGPKLIAGASSLHEGVNILRNVEGLFKSATLLLPGAKALAGLGAILAVAGVSMYGGAQWILLAGRDLFTGATAINDGVAKLAGISAIILAIGPDLIVASGLLMHAGWRLSIAGIELTIAAFSIAFGLAAIGAAVDRFTPFIGRLRAIAMAFWVLAAAFAAMNVAPVNGMRDAINGVLGAAPDLNRVGDELVVAAAKMDAGVKAFNDPVERLSVVLARLTETMTAFSTGLNIADDIGKISESFERYAGLLENTAERIEIAVRTKAIPAMRAAEEAGITEAIRSEAISTVKVLTDDHGRAKDDESVGLLHEIASYLKNMDEKIAGMRPVSKTDLDEIAGLLQAMGQSMNEPDTGFGSDLNAWSQ